VFAAGLPVSIMHNFGDGTANGPFQFVVFIPENTTGQWRVKSDEVDGIMEMLEHVVRGHHIDPDRIYLVGTSGGANGVWSLAQGYPDRWAALALLGAFVAPDVEAVKHLPAWLFHGANDRFAPVQRAREVAALLKDAGADVRYTVVPNKGYIVFHEAFDGPDLFDWLGQKRRR
jgi:predicted peptidase